MNSEWMKVMLEEIARKQAEEALARSELERLRDEQRSEEGQARSELERLRDEQRSEEGQAQSELEPRGDEQQTAAASGDARPAA